MAITVYWSPWTFEQEYFDEFLTHSDPELLLSHFNKSINKNNARDNFFSCPAALALMKNTFILRNPYTVDIDFSSGNANAINQNTIDEHLEKFTIKAASMNNALTINYRMNWIFFADAPLITQTMSPYMHKTKVSSTGFYVPGEYDINSWFRPVDGAFQLFPNESRFTCDEDEPLMYIKFLTDEKIVFKRFFLTQELYNMASSCISLKQYRKSKPLKYLYKLFHKSMINKRILSEIKKNIV